MANPTRREPEAPSRDKSLSVQQIIADPAFKELVAERSSFAWTLSLVMLAVYLIFILLVAFAHDIMATKIGGGPTSLGSTLR